MNDDEGLLGGPVHRLLQLDIAHCDLIIVFSVLVSIDASSHELFYLKIRFFGHGGL